MEHFDQEAKNWDKDLDKKERAGFFADEIVKAIQQDKSMDALEFGCGTGLLSYELKDVFNTITLVDTSVGMMEVLKEKIARDKIKNFNPVLKDLLEDKCLKKDFDVIFTLMTMHHILDLSKIFKIFNSILNTGGYLCIADLELEDGSFHSNHTNFEGHNGFDREKLRLILLEHGFEVVHNEICNEIVKEIDNRVFNYPLFLMICKKIQSDPK